MCRANCFDSLDTAMTHRDGEEEDHVVETAIRQLNAGINKVIDRWERKQGKDLPQLRQRVQRLARRIRHVFVALRQNQHSLTLGMACLDRMLHNTITNNNNMDVRLAFATLLRLHDGYILTVSGECRHAGDRDRAQRSPFPSQLHENEALYSKNNVYSGTAWDDWNDAKCGLRTRLCQLLRLHDYDDFVEPGRPAAVFEDMVSQTEQTLIGMQGGFTRLKAKMERVYSAKIVWRDRMEKLSADRVQLERVGSQFQVPMALGVTTMEEWEALMKPMKKKDEKKKKRIIADSDDDDDVLAKCGAKKPSNTATKQQRSVPQDDHGLQVKISVLKKDVDLPVDVSINEIKQTMGVDIQQLEEARLEVEGEEEQARIEADAIDDAEPEISSDQAKRRVKRARKGYENALLTNDDTEIWNARELLREALMRAGDILLSTTTTTATNDDQALSYFESAAALVRSQQQLDRKLGNDPYFALNLLMLLCRAEINIAIACLHMADRCRPPRRQQCLERAYQEAEAVILHSQQMTQVSEDAADRLRAFQLHALAQRNKGIALWHLRKREEAREAFRAAGTSPLQTSSDGTTEDDSILMECHLERYNAWTTFADLAIGILERANMTALRENESFYNDMFLTLKAAMTGATSASTDIRMLTEKQGTLWPTGMTSPDELTRSLSELENWWKVRQNTAALRIDIQEPRNVPRGDISLPVTKAPTRRFIIGGYASSTKPPASTSKGQRQYRKFSTNRSHRQQAAAPAMIRRYRKWREDMVMDESTGEWVAKLEYPAVAPPMSLEFAAILAARRSQAYQ
jgi:tetratricopeptide (TPR) repeat protein